MELGKTSGRDDGSGAGSCWEPPARSPLLEACHLSYLTASRKGLEAWRPQLVLDQKGCDSQSIADWMRILLTHIGPRLLDFFLPPSLNPRCLCPPEVASVSLQEGNLGQRSPSSGGENQPFPSEKGNLWQLSGGSSLLCDLQLRTELKE